MGRLGATISKRSWNLERVGATVLDFSQSRISKTLGIKKHEVVQLEFNAKNELLKIGEQSVSR